MVSIHYRLSQRKPGVALIIRSARQGSGKGLFWHWVCNFVVGYHNSFFTQKPGDLGIGYNHNSLMEGNILAVLEELDKHGGIYRNMKSLMSLITEPYTVVNPKGKDQRRVQSFTHLVMLCNDKNPVRIPPDDRRFACFDCCDDFIGNRLYFNQLKEDLNPFMGAIFAYYLLNIYPAYKHIDIRKPPDTKIRRSIIEESKTSIYKFLCDIATGEYPSLNTEDSLAIMNFEIHDTEDSKITSVELYDLFKTWCTSTGEYSGYTQNNFSIEVNKELETKTSQIWKNGKNQKGWKLSKQLIQMKLNGKYEVQINIVD